MLILYNAQNAGENPGASYAVVFGVGLIGTYLIQNLFKHHYRITRSFSFSWQDPFLRKKEKADILHCLQHFLKNLPDSAVQATDSPCRIDFVWCAGKGGFAMEQIETQSEMDAFSEVLEMALTVSRENPSCLVRFHMISSAGGLYEGQRNVDDNSPPTPKRPYAFLKLAQEKALGDCGDMARFIYRVTSIYGFAGLNRRLGLIPTLLWNGSRNRVSTIFGAPETLRDYVWAGDLGAFMAGMIASEEHKSARFVLASGKPSALFEVLNRVEKVLNKRLFCHYVKTNKNAEHNTFSMRIRPMGWNTMDFGTGIRKTYQAMVQK